MEEKCLHYSNKFQTTFNIFWIYITSGCEKGYTGQNCEVLCLFPTYGMDCQSICNCTQTKCNPVDGCKGHSTKLGIIFKQLIMIEI